MNHVYHVSVTGSDRAPGTEREPLRTINRAASLAVAGDTVVVHKGEYREWVDPQRGGLSATRPIVYEAAPGEHVTIKGSERVARWEPEGDGIWTAHIPNSFFGDFNPFGREIAGDWIVYDEGTTHRHLGSVFLNGIPLWEVGSRTEVDRHLRHTCAVDQWTGISQELPDASTTDLVWYAEVDESTTTIIAHMGDADPNHELTEITVRRSVFFPREHHIDHITVRGFELAQAATPWAPPTADQPGLIGPNWAKGWIIEDNVIHDATCVAVSLGKEHSTGHNLSTDRRDKPGYQYQLEAVFTARARGWDREHIGSHLVRRNMIFRCGQAGIVGHLGAVFSTIEDNDIHDIGNRRQFYGYEIAGIKLHAAIDTVIRHNRIRHCALGTWLDWETQGTRVTRNVYADNTRDLFIEVSHGPYIVDHNVFASPASIENFSEGGAFVNNLVLGTVRREPVLDRATPYHLPHSTQVAGYGTILGADDRWFGNVFASVDPTRAYSSEVRDASSVQCGTSGYDSHPTSLAEYLERISEQAPGDHERYAHVRRPVYIQSNLYLGDARPFDREQVPQVLRGPVPPIVLEERDGSTVLRSALPAEFEELRTPVLSGRALPRTSLSDADFEERDGSPARLDVDLLGVAKDEDGTSPVGPLADWGSGSQLIELWP